VASSPGWTCSLSPSRRQRYGASGVRLSGTSAEAEMLKLALFFLVISLIAAVFGYGGIAVAAAGIAKILFFIFIVIFVVLLIAGLMAGSALF
jgi:uncharacterized membrane protein YtjA (UPF0391 family)